MASIPPSPIVYFSFFPSRSLIPPPTFPLAVPRNFRCLSKAYRLSLSVAPGRRATGETCGEAGRRLARNLQGEPTFASLLFYFELGGIVLSFGISNNFFFLLLHPAVLPSFYFARPSPRVFRRAKAPPPPHRPRPLVFPSPRRRFFFLSFLPPSLDFTIPAVIRHYRTSKPLALSRPVTLTGILSFGLNPRPPAPPDGVSTLRFPLNNNYSAILSALLYRKRKAGGGARRWLGDKLERRRGRTDGRIKTERHGGIKFLITLQCQWKKKCEACELALSLSLSLLFFPRISEA